MHRSVDPITTSACVGDSGFEMCHSTSCPYATLPPPPPPPHVQFIPTEHHTTPNVSLYIHMYPNTPSPSKCKFKYTLCIPLCQLTCMLVRIRTYTITPPHRNSTYTYLPNITPHTSPVYFCIRTYNSRHHMPHALKTDLSTLKNLRPIDHGSQTNWFCWLQWNCSQLSVLQLSI